MRIVVYDGHKAGLVKRWVNGRLGQNGNTRDMIGDIAKLIECASHVMTLYPGDRSEP